MLLLVLSLTVGVLWVDLADVQTPERPRLVPFFSRVEDGPTFFVECRNDTEKAISSGADVWAFAGALRIDGNEVQEWGGRIGPGLTVDVPSGENWRGILALKQSREGPSAPVKFGAMVRGGQVIQLTPGRHSISVQCNGEWSDDVPFYWEAGPDHQR